MRAQPRVACIVNLSPESSKLFDLLGSKTILLRGHGGTGKTIMFLQVAWKSYETNAKRNLVLTYNLALAADIRRSLALLNIPSDSGVSGIAVETVMSFMWKWFHALEVIAKDEEAYGSLIKFREEAKKLAAALKDTKSVAEQNEIIRSTIAFKDLMGNAS